MTPVSRFELILVLLAVLMGLELAASRLRLPPAAALILGGIAFAFIPGVPEVALDPDLVLVLFLPPLLLAGAYFTSWRDFKANLPIILELAVGAVFLTTIAVGVVAHWVEPSLPWAACFALGAIVSPPDAVAAKAVLRRVSLPPRVTMLLEAESLVNDASGLVLYRFAVAAALTGTFNAGQAAASFVGLAAGGVAVGVVFGFGVSFLLKRLQESNLAVIGSFLGAWVSYIAADALGVSGVLSTVACGLIVGWRQHAVLSAATRMQAAAVWDVVTFVLESLIFILIGLSLRGIVIRFGGGGEAIERLLPATLAVIAAVVLARFAWIFPATYLPRWASRRYREADPIPPIGIPVVMSWAGMRGVVSLAAALALPEEFPGRDFILAVTFAVILVTVLVQGMTLAPLIRLLRVDRHVPMAAKTLSEAAARARIAATQVATVEKLSLAPDGTHLHPRLMEQYGYRARASARFSDDTEGLIPHRDAHFNVVLAAVAAGREELLRLHRHREIHDTVLNTLEQELDLEEMTARRLTQERRPLR